MLTIENFCDLICKDTQITLVNARYHTNVYIGCIQNIPDEYMDCLVEDFTMNDSGHILFKIKVPNKILAGTGWQEGDMRVNGNRYHYWVKSNEKDSVYGIKGGRVSKLTLRRKGIIVCNYERGWETEPVDDETWSVVETLLNQYN